MGKDIKSNKKLTKTYKEILDELFKGQNSIGNDELE